MGSWWPHTEKKLPAWKGGHFLEELWLEMTENEETREKQCNILTDSNAMFKLFPRSSDSDIYLGPHVGGSSGRDKNGAGDGNRTHDVQLGKLTFCL